MLDHHIQRSIVYHLAFSESMRFSELQPDDIDSKLFTYHLKKVIKAGLVTKYPDGTYALTPEGRRIGKTVLRKDRFIDQAYSVLLLVIRRKSDGAWLLYKRNTHPLIDLTGFMQAIPNANESIVETAEKECFRKSGLKGSFSVTASGFFRVFEGDELESFTHFTLLECSDISGDLVQNDEFGEYFWAVDPDFDDPKMLPTAKVLSDLSLTHDRTFVEQTFYL